MKNIPLASPSINENDIDRVVEVLRSGALVQGDHVLQLEKSLSTHIQTNCASALSNGTSTLHLALIALDIKKGDEVIIPAFSYIATANVVELVGAKPVFVDINDRTFNIDASLIESKITTNTKAIIPVHEFGLSCDIEAVMSIAKKHNLFVIEDAACALGATYHGRYVGSFGDFGSFSFHPRKAITSGEGGMLVTNEQLYDARIKILRNHGIEMQQGKMEFVAAGFNYRLTDFQAALINSQLLRLKDIITYKQILSQVYFDELSQEKISLPFVPNACNHTWQTFHIVFDNSINRDEMIIRLKQSGVGSNYGAQCIPDQIFYTQKYGYRAKFEFPNAYRAYKQGLAIPIYEKLTQSDISYISKTINNLIKSQ